MLGDRSCLVCDCPPTQFDGGKKKVLDYPDSTVGPFCSEVCATVWPGIPWHVRAERLVGSVARADFLWSEVRAHHDQRDAVDWLIVEHGRGRRGDLGTCGHADRGVGIYGSCPHCRYVEVEFRKRIVTEGAA